MSLFKSIATFGGFTLLSRVTGFLRDMFIANYLGAGAISDAFLVALKLPNLFRSLFAEGAFTASFVPLFSHKLVTDGKQKALEFASHSITILTFFLGLFIIIIEFFMPEVVNVLAPGFAEHAGKIDLAISLSRITFPFLLLISIVSFQSGILNSFGKFAATASSSIILNVVTVLAAIAFIPFGVSPAYGLAVGITVSGFIEIIWLGYFLRRENAFLKPRFDVFTLLKDPDIRLLFKRIAPGVLGSGVYQINMMVDTILVSLVGTGAVSWLYYANRLQQLPLGVVGAAISVALLPVLSKHLRAGENEQAREYQNKAIEYGALLSIPAAVAMIVLAFPIINILFQHGKFGALETKMTAQALIAYAVGLPVYVLVKALTPNFFARGDTKTPVKYSIIVLITNLVFALVLMEPFGHVGIASATTIAAFVSFYQYYRGLKKRGFWSFPKYLIIKTAKIFLCSIIMGIAIYSTEIMLNLYYGNWLDLSFILKLIIFTLLCVLGVASFAFMTKLTGVLNISDLIKLISRKGKKNAATSN